MFIRRDETRSGEIQPENGKYEIYLKTGVPILPMELVELFEIFHRAKA
jgi:hypothetical protein